MNADGMPDLIDANFGDNTVGVLLGNGDGSFQSQTTFATGANPYSVVSSDINVDGIPDLVASNFSSSNVSLLLGNSNGNFSGQVYTILIPPVLSLTVGAGAPNFSASWLNSGAVPIENMAQATVTAAPNLASLTVTLATFHTGDVLSVPSLGGASITSSYAAGTLSLSGSDTLAHYQTALRFINYDNTAGGPGTGFVSATFVVGDGVLFSSPVTATINVSVASGQVLGNRLFYNNSKYDGNDGAISAADDAAIASDKIGFSGVGTANFANVSPATRGITGIMVDLASGIGSHGSINLTSGDITFNIAPAPFVGATYNQLSTWTPAPTPLSISVRMGAGTGGSDRVEITWANGVIKNTWLEVNVAADANTGLSTPDIFYFGNAAGDSGIGDTPSLAKVDINDSNAAISNLAGLTTPVWNIMDYTKDGKVDVNDANAAALGIFTLQYIANPVGPFAPDTAPAIASQATANAAATSTSSTGDAGIATGLTDVLGRLPTVPLWLANRLKDAGDPNSGSMAKIFQRLGDAAAPQDRVSYLESEQVAEVLERDDCLLDNLLVEFGPTEVMQ